MGRDGTTRQDLAADIRREIARSIGVPVERVVDSASIVDDLGADSLLHMTVIMDLERRFGITISDAEAAQFVSVGDAVKAVRRCVAS